MTAVTVAPAYRRQRLAEKLMALLEDVSIHMHNAYFVDLFVRVTNTVAISMYKKASRGPPGVPAPWPQKACVSRRTCS